MRRKIVFFCPSMMLLFCIGCSETKQTDEALNTHTDSQTKLTDTQNAYPENWENSTYQPQLFVANAQ